MQIFNPVKVQMSQQLRERIEYIHEWGGNHWFEIQDVAEHLDDVKDAGLLAEVNYIRQTYGELHFLFNRE